MKAPIGIGTPIAEPPPHITGRTGRVSDGSAGLAEVYRGEFPRGFDPAEYRQAEKEAKQAMRGMWSLGDKYVSPKDWRRKRKK